MERLAEGFTIADLVSELALLRSAIFRVWNHADASGTLADLHLINVAIDQVVEASVARYVDATSEHRFTQLALERERLLAKLESLLAASPIGIAFVDRELKYLRINAALAALNGRPAAEHIGRTVREVLPAVAAQLEPLLTRVMETGESVLNLELTLPGERPEDTRWLLANYFPVRAASGAIDGVGGIVLDISDTRRAQEALRIEQARLQSIVEHAPAAIWIKDVEGRIVLANHQLADALGHTRERVLGHRSDEILPAEVALQHQEHDAVVLREKRALEVEETVPSPGGLRTFLAVKFPIPGDPPLVGAIATEITERKHMEAELRLAVRAREDVLAVVSHDLRNPLATVELSTSLLMAQPALDHRARRHLEMIHHACLRMNNLIDDLLDSASISAGKLAIETKREAIEDVTLEAIDLQVPLAEEKGIAVERECAVQGLFVRCDRDRIIQVFGNLIGNAIKFCRSGDTITIRGSRDGDDVKFSIADTGPGIAPDQLTQLFEAYWSAPGNSKRGSGLGLFIVRGIVESHGGRVWVDSRPGHGATFSFTLPLDR